MQRDQILRTRDICKMLGISTTTLHRRRHDAEAQFPKPIQLGPNSVGWKLSEVNDWLESRKAVA